MFNPCLVPLLLAQVVTPESPDMEVFGRLAAALGVGQWFLAAPLIAWFLVRILRLPFITNLVPFFASTWGGYILGAATSLACALANAAIEGAPITLLLVVQTLYVWAGSVLTHASLKRTAGGAVAGATTAP